MFVTVGLCGAVSWDTGGRQEVRNRENRAAVASLGLGKGHSRAALRWAPAAGPYRAVLGCGGSSSRAMLSTTELGSSSRESSTAP